jgi:hypothetical protein
VQEDDEWRGVVAESINRYSGVAAALMRGPADQ